jgi:hypothetical protein
MLGAVFPHVDRGYDNSAVVLSELDPVAEPDLSYRISNWRVI